MATKKQKTIENIDERTWSVSEDIESNKSTIYSYTDNIVTYMVYDTEPKVNQYAEDVLSALEDAVKNDKDFKNRLFKAVRENLP